MLTYPLQRHRYSSSVFPSHLFWIHSDSLLPGGWAARSDPFAAPSAFCMRSDNLLRIFTALGCGRGDNGMMARGGDSEASGDPPFLLPIGCFGAVEMLAFLVVLDAGLVVWLTYFVLVLLAQMLSHHSLSCCCLKIKVCQSGTLQLNAICFKEGGEDGTSDSLGECAVAASNLLPPFARTGG